MKTAFFILLFFISCIGFAQNNHIVKTEEGRRVLLKADFTWEYIDTQIPAVSSAASSVSKAAESDTCKPEADFVEPKLNNKIQSQLKKGRATISDIKRKVAKDYDCTEADIILLSFSERKATGIYYFCAKGTKVSYKRNGHAIVKNGKFF
jgi:hypothetical protein